MDTQIIPSSRQTVIYDTFQETDYNLLIQAVAGSGKTTVLLGLLGYAQYRTLFLAFNKSIQEEISSRIDQAGFQHAKAMTLHSLGLMALNFHFGKVTIDKNKNYKLIKSLQDYNKGLFARMSWEEKSKTTITLMEMNDVSRIYMTNDVEKITTYMEEMDKFFFLHPLMEELWQEFLYIRTSFEEQKVIDFVDMIYMVVDRQLPIPVQPYYLMVDECQDLNMAQHEFINQFINQGDIHKWIAVGDRRQSIYGFSGSHSSSFDLFKERPNVVELPLDVCYRCPQLVIKEANLVYDVMQGHKTELGVVSTIDNFDEVKEGSMIICRNSAPLINAYFELLSRDKKVYLKGDDILNELTRFLKPYQYKKIKQVLDELRTEINSLEEKTNLTDKERFKVYKLNDSLKNLTLLASNFCKPTDKVEEVLTRLSYMFDTISDNDAIILCTIHKSKGLEADIVYILNEFLIPSKFAKSVSQLEQEKNLRYVARTRAKKELHYLNIGKKPNKEE